MLFPLSNLRTTTLNYRKRYATHAFKIDLQTDLLPHMASQPPKNRERAFRNMVRKIISNLWKGQFYNVAHTPAGQPLGRKASGWYIQIARDNLERLDLLNQPNFYVSPTLSFHFFDSEPKIPATFLLTSFLATLTHIPLMPNNIAPCVFPYKSLEMRLIPFFTALIPLHLPNLQSIALCSTFDNLIFGHRQPTQTPNK